MKKQLLLFLCVLGITISQAQTFNEGVLQYTVTDATNNYVSLNKIGSTCPTGSLSIPQTVNHGGKTYAVKSIEDNAFDGCSDLTRVTMNSGLFHIGNSAFRGCTSLTFVSLHSTVTSIGDYAFDNCRNLIIRNLPINLTNIGIGTFRNSGIRSVVVPETVSSIGNLAFSGSNLFQVIIPNSVISIGDSAFEDCNDLGRIDIPNSVTSIGISAFSNCIGLEIVNIGNSVTSIGNFAFKECNNLTTFRVRWDSPLAINASVFEDVALENIPLTIPANAETAYQTAPVWQDFGLFLKSFNDGVLEYTVTEVPNSYVSVKKYNDTCPTGDLTIPETIINNGTTYTITNIEEQAFISCSDLTGVLMPDSLTNIGSASFRGCTNLKSIIIPNGITHIEFATFHNCINLTNVTFPEGLTEIGENVFTFCRSLTDVTLPEGLTKIGRASFQECRSILSITIPDSVTSIGDYAFSRCTGLTNFTIPNGITNIEEYTFWESSGLINVNIPDGVTSIGFGAFIECTSLISVSIPASVNSIGERAFEKNSSLTSVTTHWSTPQDIVVINANVFNDVAISNIPLTVPAGTVSAYQAAAVWKDFGSFKELSLLDFVIATVRLYPNPTSSFLKIDLGGSSELKKAIIYNNLGQLISEENETQISVSNYSKGLYFAEIETSQGKVTKKFLVE